MSKGFQEGLTREAALTDRLRSAINDLSNPWGFEPIEEDGEEEERGSALVDRLIDFGVHSRDQVREALHIGVKRAMAVVRSGYLYNMDVVSSGFIFDKDKTPEENHVWHQALIAAAEVPGTRLARKFEPEVLPPVGEEDAEVLLEPQPGVDGENAGAEGGGDVGGDEQGTGPGSSPEPCVANLGEKDHVMA